MSRRLLPLAVVALVGVGAVVVYLARSDGDLPAAPPTSAPSVEAAPASLAQPGRALRFHVAPGTVSRYRWTLRQTNQTDVMAGAEAVEVPQPVSGSVAIDAVVRWTGLPPLDGVQVAELALEPGAALSVVVQDQELFADPAEVTAVTDVPVRVGFDATGQALWLEVPERSSIQLERLAQLLVSEAQWRLEGGEEWEVDERTLHGTAPTHYRVVGHRDGAQVEKVRQTYSELRVEQLVPSLARKVDAEYALDLDGTGALRSFAGREHIEASAGNGRLALSVGTEVALVRLDVAAAVADARAFRWERLSPGEIRLSDDAEHRALVQQAEGLTGAQLVADLERYGQAGRVPDHNRWLWRSAAALRLDPDRATEVAAFAMAPGTQTPGRELALDLLVNAGTEETQRALLIALESPAVRGDPNYSMLFQRLNLIRFPSTDAVAWAEKKLAQGSAPEQLLATNALGSMAGHLARGERPAEGARLASVIAAALQKGGSDEEQEVRLLALGNAALPEQTSLVRGFATSESSRIRHATATALRHLDDADSRHTLLELAHDPSERVQIRALASLRKRKDLTADDRGYLKRLVERQAIVEGSYNTLISTLGPWFKSDPTVRATFEVILSQPLQDNEIKARIRSILEE